MTHDNDDPSAHCGGGPRVTKSPPELRAERFICPKCGSLSFGSSNCLKPGKMVRHCAECDFSFPQQEDHKYFHPLEVPKITLDALHHQLAEALNDIANEPSFHSDDLSNDHDCAPGCVGCAIKRMAAPALAAIALANRQNARTDQKELPQTLPTPSTREISNG